VTVTLPSPGRLALALALIVAVFFAALAIGRSNRPRAPHAAPATLRPAAVSATAPAVAVPAAAPPVPPLKVRGPRVRTVRAVRSAGVI
jgi:hypothetical protein